MSPMSDSFRSNLRNFPSLVNCTTIDYYTEWPIDALLSVAKVQLSSDNLDLGDNKESVIKMFSVIHKSVEQISVKLFDELKRYNYVTPTSYLELIRMYKQVLLMKRNEFNKLIQRYEVGLTIIEKAQKKVSDLQTKIKEDEPILEKLEKDLTKQNDELQVILVEVNTKNEEVSKSQAIQNEEVAKIEEIKRGIAEECKETEEQKASALKLAEQISPKDITEVSSYAKPPESIAFLLKFFVLLYDEEKQVKNKENSEDWFAVAKTKLLKNVQDLKDSMKRRIIKEEITDKQYKKIENIYDPEKFDTPYYSTVSSACEKLALWVRAMKSI